MKLAIPSMLMVCFEWWVYEFGGFFAGMLSEDELAAQHVVIMIAFITYMFPLGIQAAACARVGNALGAGDTARALLACKLSLITFGLVEGVVLGCTKTVIGYIFTSDEKIAGIVSNLMNAYCFLQLFDGLVCVCTGIFLGTGRQRIPAVANFVAYYCIGLTLSVVLMFVAELRVLGFWLGLLISRYQLLYRTSSLHLLTLNGLQKDADTLTDGYMPVKTQQYGDNSEVQVGQEVQQQKSGRLSSTQLIIRRGLIVFAAVGFLAVGAAVHFFVPLPETHATKNNSTFDWINTTYAPHSGFSFVE
uniref:Solute carrier family 47 member 4 n=1 Tax=Fundulus heteroclitus TaxID=8078 RepID=A0A3Q2NU82_FUNHE